MVQTTNLLNSGISFIYKIDASQLISVILTILVPQSFLPLKLGVSAVDELLIF